MTDRPATLPPPPPSSPSSSPPPASSPPIARDAPPIGFARGGVRYAVAATAVRQVLVEPAVTRVPSTPPALLGLIAFRGAVVPLLEPGAPGGAQGVQRAAAAALVVDGATGLLALAADAVTGFAPDGDALDGADGAERVEPDELEQRARAWMARAPTDPHSSR